MGAIMQIYSVVSAKKIILNTTLDNGPAIAISAVAVFVFNLLDSKLGLNVTGLAQPKQKPQDKSPMIGRTIVPIVSMCASGFNVIRSVHAVFLSLNQ